MSQMHIDTMKMMNDTNNILLGIFEFNNTKIVESLNKQSAFYDSVLQELKEIKNANIKYFVDSNTNQQGKIINNLKVKSPDVLINKKSTVFVSTYIYNKEIKNILLEKYKFEGKIILL